MNNTPLWLIWFCMLGILFNTSLIASNLSNIRDDIHEIVTSMHLDEINK